MYNLRLTWTDMHSMRAPVSLTTMDLGGLSSARRSMINSFPFSVVKYIAAPSGEKEADVKGTLKSSVRNSLYCA